MEAWALCGWGLSDGGRGFYPRSTTAVGSQTPDVREASQAGAPRWTETGMTLDHVPAIWALLTRRHGAANAFIRCVLSTYYAPGTVLGPGVASSSPFQRGNCSTAQKGRGLTHVPISSRDGGGP